MFKIKLICLEKDEGADGCAESESSHKKRPNSGQLHKSSKLAGGVKGLGVKRPAIKRKREGHVKEYKSAVRSSFG